MTPDISKAPHLVKRTHVASDSTCARKPPWLAASCMPPPPHPPAHSTGHELCRACISSKGFSWQRITEESAMISCIAASPPPPIANKATQLY